MRGLPGKVISIVPAVALALAAACGSDSDTESPRASIDLTAAISATSLGDISTLPGAATVLGFPGASLIQSVDPGQCPFASSSQSFVCPSQTRNGLTFSLSYFLLDASGHNQSSLNATTTSAVHTILDINGHTPLATNSSTAAIHHHSDLTLSGLQSTTRTLNGSARDKDTVTANAGSVTSRSVIDAATTAANVAVPSGSRYPSSGTITADVTTSTTFGSTPAITATAHAVVTFNGTNIATAIITIGASTRTCQIDLNGGTPVCTGG